MNLSQFNIRKSVLSAVVVACMGAWLCSPLMTATAHADDLDQNVSSSENISSDKTVIDIGHVDIGPKVVDGKWSVYARDDSGGTPVWRDPNNIVLKVKDAGLLDAPTEGDYAVMEGHAGDKWWVIPQTQNPDVVWLGWNTQDPQATQMMNRGATMTLGPVSGPGKSWMFLQDGTFGKPRFLVDGQKKEPQDIWVDVNTHVHANWVFTKPGVYTSPVKFCTKSDDGKETCASSTLRFAVGDGTSTDEAFAASVAQPQETADSKTTASSGSKTQKTDSSGVSAGSEQPKNVTNPLGDNVWTLTIVCIVIMLLGIGGYFFWRNRQMARDIERARSERLNNSAESSERAESQSAAENPTE